jgi:Protein of unknown function (DUF4230)
MRSWLAIIALGCVALIAVLWFSKREKPLDPQAVVTQVRQLSQLATVEYTIQKVVGLKEEKQPVGSESILLIVQARVQGGVDLASLRAGDVTVGSDGTVALRLPPAKILNLSIDEKETKVWDRQKTWWAPWIPYSLDLEQRARVTGIEAARQAALDMGILAQADRNAETSIRGLLGLAGVKSVQIAH